MRRNKQQAFTLIELVLVILLVGLLASVAVPNFVDMRSDAKNAATKGALGGMRSAISISVAAIALREAQGVPYYPVYNEMSVNAFNGSHPVLSGTNIMDPTYGIPPNPWTTTNPAKILDCSALAAQGSLLSFPNSEQGWCYFGGSTGSKGNILGELQSERRGVRYREHVLAAR